MMGLIQYNKETRIIHSYFIQDSSCLNSIQDLLLNNFQELESTKKIDKYKLLLNPKNCQIILLDQDNISAPVYSAFNSLPSDIETAKIFVFIRIGLYFTWMEEKYLHFNPRKLHGLFYNWLLKNSKFKHLKEDIFYNKNNFEDDYFDIQLNIFTLTEEISSKSKNINNFTNTIIYYIESFTTDEEKYEFINEITIWLHINNIYLSEFYNYRLTNFPNTFVADSFFYIRLTLKDILNRQDWKLGLKYIEFLISSKSLNGKDWSYLADFCFQLGETCYNLYKGSNYALPMLYFEKALNFVAKSEQNKLTLQTITSTLWYIGQIEFERGYSIRGSEYQLASKMYHKQFSENELKTIIPIQSESKTKNAIILSTFQAATDLFIASKVNAQLFQKESSKNYLFQSYKFIKELLYIIDDNYPIVERIQQFLLQIHNLGEKEGFIHFHNCELNFQKLSVLELIQHIENHIESMNISEMKLFWLTVNLSGISLFEYDFEGNSSSNKNSLYSSFIHAISKWGELEFESGPAQELNFLGNSFIIETIEDIEVIAVVTIPNESIKLTLRKFAQEFYRHFEQTIKDWNGNKKLFESKSIELMNEIFSQYTNTANE